MFVQIEHNIFYRYYVLRIVHIQQFNIRPIIKFKECTKKDLQPVS